MSITKIFEKRHLKPKIIFGSVVIAFVLIAISLWLYYFIIPPKVNTSTPKDHSSGVGLVDDIVIKFNKPINREAMNFTISPEVSGQWHFSGGLVSNHLFNQAVFTPDKPFATEKEYVVKVTNIRNFMNTKQGPDFQFTFQTENIPKIDHASIKDSQTEVALNDPIILYLSQKNNKVVDFNIKLEPPIDFTSSISPDFAQYTLKLNQPLEQGTVYKLSAQSMILASSKNSVPGDSWEISFTSKKPPGLANYSPQGDGILTDIKTLVLDFDRPMVQNEVISHISINPSIEGNWQWQTPTKLVYNINEKLPFATAYSILITKGAHDQQGGITTEDIKISFTTIGNVIVSAFFPNNGAENIATDAIVSVTFSQAVDHDSAQKAFSISPNPGGNFSWTENKMIFSPQELNKDSTYEINIAAGVKSLFGLDSNEAFSASFSTINSSTVLDIGQDFQDRALSCEAAALKMALNYRGVGVSEDDIMARIGYDPTIRNGNIWGDPNNAFVGDINGRQNSTGYGVYWGPIARAANSWRPTSAFSGWSVSQIAQAVAGNNPVVLWGTIGGATRDDWQTPDDQQIIAWIGEHARTVIGFSGPADNPTSFVINDPYVGRITWSASQLAGNMSAFGGSGVVVY